MYDEDAPTHYGMNMINQKITFPRDDNFSDDELSFLPYFVYFNAIKVQREREKPNLNFTNMYWGPIHQS